MLARNCQLFIQLAIIALLALSAALLMDQLGASAAFCQVVQGCALARQASARWLGPVPLPLVAIVAYGGLLGLSLAPSRVWAARSLFWLSALGGLVGLLLLLVQAFWLSRFCPYCVLVDLISIAIVGPAFWLWRSSRQHEIRRGALGPLTVLGFAGMALVMPPLWAHLRPAAALPPALRSLQVPGKVTIIEFVDLQCPHCRALYPTLEAIRREHASELALVRLHVPRRVHRPAWIAARLLHCLRGGPRGERLEQALFLTEFGSEAGLRTLAEQQGMTSTEIASCLGDPDSERAVDSQVRLFESLGRFGLPLTYVGGERISGAMPKAVYRAAMARVQRPRGQAERQSVAFFGLAALLAAAVYVLGKPRER